MISQIKKYISLVVFAHTIFALPFALIGFALSLPSPLSSLSLQSPLSLLLLKILLCMVTARNSAMSFNRYIDRHIDAQNQRTKTRELPSGSLTSKAVLTFFLLNMILFIISCYTINNLCFYLSFPALMIICGYSYTKRFTWWSHMILGLSLSIAPAGAYIATTGTLALPILLLSIIVLFWVTGFDILYALPDEEHDRTHHLHSIPQRFGRKRALWISAGAHLFVIPLLYLFGRTAHLTLGYWIAASLFTAFLLYQHLIITENDISKLNTAFFTSNGIASILFATLTITNILHP